MGLQGVGSGRGEPPAERPEGRDKRKRSEKPKSILKTGSQEAVREEIGQLGPELGASGQEQSQHPQAKWQKKNVTWNSPLAKTREFEREANEEEQKASSSTEAPPTGPEKEEPLPGLDELKRRFDLLKSRDNNL